LSVISRRDLDAGKKHSAVPNSRKKGSKLELVKISRLFKNLKTSYLRKGIKIVFVRSND
jgi:hypothetical protein